MAIATIIGFGVVVLLLCGHMASVCIEDGAWPLAGVAMIMALVTVVGTVAACIAVSQA